MQREERHKVQTEFNREAESALAKERSEDEQALAKRTAYRSEIQGVWDAERRIQEFKQKMQHDLGVALADDKIRLLKLKAEGAAEKRRVPQAEVPIKTVTERIGNDEEGAIPKNLIRLQAKIDSLKNSKIKSASVTPASRRQDGSS